MAVWHKLTRKNGGRTECGINLWDHTRTKASSHANRVQCPKCIKVMDGRDNQEGAFRCSTKKFSELMTQALIKNAHKDGWSGCNVRWLVGRLGEEVEELDNALSIRNWQEAIEECADIANFAMMVAERIATIHKEEIDK